MSILTITGTVKNEAGLETAFTGTINVVDPVVRPPVVSSVVVTPASAPVGTLRRITITASDPQGQVLTYTCKVGTQNATPVAGQPNVFTFTP
jgi:hypothetical protein